MIIRKSEATNETDVIGIGNRTVETLNSDSAINSNKFLKKKHGVQQIQSMINSFIYSNFN